MAEETAARGPPPGHHFCTYYGIPLARPPADVDWWSREVCASQPMPRDGEPKLLDLVQAHRGGGGEQKARSGGGAVDVDALRAALGLPMTAAETRETIDPPIHALTDPERAAERVCRLAAEFAALAPHLAPPLPACARARDVHWLLAEPAWAERLRPIKAALQATHGEANELMRKAYVSLGKAIVKCRWLHAHRSDATVNLAATQPARALQRACETIQRLVHELHALDLGLVDERIAALDGRLLAAQLVACGDSADDGGGGGVPVEPWTGGLAGQPAARSEPSSVEQVRDMVRAGARARADAAAADGGARGGADMVLGHWHSAESVHALALLGELALALDAYTRLLDSTAIGARALTAYARLQEASVNVLPIPNPSVAGAGAHVELGALPWLLRLPAWRGALPVGELPPAALAELDVALEHAATAEAAIVDNVVNMALQDAASEAGAREQLRALASGALAELARLAPKLSAAELGTVRELAALRAKAAVSWLLRGPIVDWTEMPSHELRADGSRARCRPDVLCAWEDEVWDRIRERQDALADDMVALAQIGRLGLALDHLLKLAARRADRKQHAAADSGDVGDGGRAQKRARPSGGGGAPAHGGVGAAAGAPASIAQPQPVGAMLAAPISRGKRPRID
ncbi:hypothetical protein KFE25_014006 [Diacronema lutheri]|uniref:Uncharacterized protein n=1 Tax=Diacronema lutheri TaxID=2081491 RepID=A0A8J5XIS9_DIALT|nr:hypothetical protein KFE25_014006 [Diacronema lutheri]